MRPTAIERNLLTGTAARDYMKKMIETDHVLTAALVKNLIFTVKGAEQYSGSLNEEDLMNEERLIEYTAKIFQHISEESTRDNIPTFSTTEVAKYIGVSPQTINTWLREGKIIGVEKEEKKWSKIPEDAEVIFTNGKQVRIAVLKTNWEKENQQPEVDEIAYLEASIQELEKKYGGPFEAVFGGKTIKELTVEDTDASVWWSYKARLKHAKISGH
ncbi:helix-turn-helix domain-containing protein [Saccharibacillus sp. CPCC 101409]|uniref:helix-turn-helix domain-containing protein n=1 Tax=Saccharibacillus sp. CPCC 101409 TaxID=3058041 RepID=UPI002674015A|nr:helix-turn-helix domain-containing protein [Saccharibacillus sp. CPCC 101409]MDO3409891.1 helix-turn-helix domain-containing protein [Saccharibacillus sp. CPCC 101409]